MLLHYLTARQGGQTVRDKADPYAERKACDNIYKPKVWRQSGCKTSTEIPVAPEPQTGV